MRIVANVSNPCRRIYRAGSPLLNGLFRQVDEDADIRGVISSNPFRAIVRVADDSPKAHEKCCGR